MPHSALTDLTYSPGRMARRGGVRLWAGLVGLAVNVPALAAPESDGGSSVVDVSSLARLTIGLMVVVAVILVVAFLLRRSGGLSGSVGGQLRVLGAVSVGQRERVVLVKAGKQQLLVGVAPGQVRTLHVLEEPIEGAESEDAAAGAGMRGSPFAQRLHRLMQQHEKRQ